MRDLLNGEPGVDAPAERDNILLATPVSGFDITSGKTNEDSWYSIFLENVRVPTHAVFPPKTFAGEDHADVQVCLYSLDTCNE